MSKKSATDIIQEAISSFVAEAKGELMSVHIHSDGKKIGEVSPEDFRKSTGNRHSFLADLVKDFNSQKEARGEPERASIQVKNKKPLTESDELESATRSFDESESEMWVIPHKKDKRESLGHAQRWPGVGKIKGVKSPNISSYEASEKAQGITPHWTAYAHDRKGDGKVHHLGDFPTSEEAHRAIVNFHRAKSYN